LLTIDSEIRQMEKLEIHEKATIQKIAVKD